MDMVHMCMCGNSKIVHSLLASASNNKDVIITYGKMHMVCMLIHTLQHSIRGFCYMWNSSDKSISQMQNRDNVLSVKGLYVSLLILRIL